MMGKAKGFSIRLGNIVCGTSLDNLGKMFRLDSAFTH